MPPNRFDLDDFYDTRRSSIRSRPRFEQIHQLDPSRVRSMTIKMMPEAYDRFRLTIRLHREETRTLLFEMDGSEVIEFLRPGVRSAGQLQAGDELICLWERGRWTITESVTNHLPSYEAPTEDPMPETDSSPLSAEVLDDLPPEAVAYIADLQTKLRTARLDLRTQKRLTREREIQIDEERAATQRATRAKNAAISAQGRAEQDKARAQTAQAHAESILADLDRLRTTAVVWRDGTNGTAAKLNAFTDFCDALDSLPVPQD